MTASFFVLILGDAFFFGDSESGCFLYSFCLYCLLNDDGGGGSSSSSSSSSCNNHTIEA